MKIGILKLSTLVIVIFSSVTSVSAFAASPCGSGTTPVDGQCVPICGEGTILEGEICVVKEETFLDSEIDLLVLGVIIGAIATAFGILWTVVERKNTNKKEDVELIQKYGEQLSEIMNKESSLETKIDCSLYVERYLDTLEQIASLYRKGSLRKNVADYFENHFAYGINLWQWYNKNVLKFDNDLIMTKWITGDYSNEDERWTEFRWWCREGYGTKRKFFELFSQKNKIQVDKIKPFKLNTRSEILDFKRKRSDGEKKLHLDMLYDLVTDNQDVNDDVVEKYLYEKGVSKEAISELIKEYGRDRHYGVLPDVMRDDYDNIPEENGLSKGELVSTIQRFSDTLNKITPSEKNLKSKIDCSLYVEQYLDTLEQIASLYRKLIIPKRGTDYFENKFAYGLNLYDWYRQYVKMEYPPFDPTIPPVDEEKEERWTDFKWFCRGAGNEKNNITKFDDSNKNLLPDAMYHYKELPEEEGLESGKLFDIFLNYGKQLIDLADKETKLDTQIDCSVYVEQYLDTLEQIAYLFRNQAFGAYFPTFFENNFAYGLTLKNWYDEHVLGAEEQQDRWREFEYYCKNYKSYGGDEEIKPFTDKQVLPRSMLLYDALKPDKTGIVSKKYPVN